MSAPSYLSECCQLLWVNRCSWIITDSDGRHRCSLPVGHSRPHKVRSNEPTLGQVLREEIRKARADPLADAFPTLPEMIKARKDPLVTALQKLGRGLALRTPPEVPDSVVGELRDFVSDLPEPRPVKSLVEAFRDMQDRQEVPGRKLQCKVRNFGNRCQLIEGHGGLHCYNNMWFGGQTNVSDKS